MIQAILRHSDVAVTRACYIKTTHPEAVEAMQRLSENLAKVESRSQLVLKNEEPEAKTVLQ